MQEADLSGHTVAVPETRELDVFCAMLERRGARVWRCPLVAIKDAPDPDPVIAWIRAFCNDSFDDLILLTGEGLRRLLGCIDHNAPEMRSPFIEALGRVRTITRGPKPGRVLRDLDLPDAKLAAWIDLTREACAADDSDGGMAPLAAPMLRLLVSYGAAHPTRYRRLRAVLVGLSIRSEDDEVNRKYKKLALKMHPDKNKAADAVDVFQKITTSYHIVSDPEKRKAYLDLYRLRCYMSQKPLEDELPFWWTREMKVKCQQQVEQPTRRRHRGRRAQAAPMPQGDSQAPREQEEAWR